MEHGFFLWAIVFALLKDTYLVLSTNVSEKYYEPGTVNLKLHGGAVTLGLNIKEEANLNVSGGWTVHYGDDVSEEVLGGKVTATVDPNSTKVTYHLSLGVASNNNPGGKYVLNVTITKGNVTVKNMTQLWVLALASHKTFNRVSHCGSCAVARLVCPVAGYPPPTVKWFEGGREIDKNSKGRLEYRPNNHVPSAVLLVKTPTKADKKAFSCQFGTERILIRLAVSSATDVIYPAVGILATLLLLLLVTTNRFAKAKTKKTIKKRNYYYMKISQQEKRV